VDDNPQSSPSGWTFGKVIVVILGAIGMLSFGSFTLIFPYFLHNPAKGWQIWWAAGGVLTLLCLCLVVAMFRSAGAARDQSRFD